MIRKPSIPKQILFDRILASSRMKMEGLQNQPFILQFITSAWEENSSEVTDTLAILTEETGRFRNDLVLREEDALKFKDPEDAQPVFQMLLLMAEGYAAGYRGAAAFDFQAVMEDFEKNIAILRKNFYKEEYLNMSEQAIVLNELTKHYGKHRGINNLSFSVNPGRVFRLYRPQRCG